jgi:hypothetical protein
MVVANLLVWWVGPWFSPVNAFVLIGLDLTMRDVLHERLASWQLALVVLNGGFITWASNPAAKQIAIASATAFICAAIADWIVYAALRKHVWAIRTNASNIVGSAVDSVIFPTLAFGVFLPAIIALQFAAKVVGGSVWSILLQPLVRTLAVRRPV